MDQLRVRPTHEAAAGLYAERYYQRDLVWQSSEAAGDYDAKNPALGTAMPEQRRLCPHLLQLFPVLLLRVFSCQRPRQIGYWRLAPSGP